VRKNILPQSYEDLLNPMWNGQIVIGARTYEWFATVIHAMGEERGLGLMRQLAKQNPQLRPGRTLLGQLVAAGEFKVALSAYSRTFEQLKKAGAPVDWISLDPVFANTHPLAVSSKAPHPNAARVFVDFVLSREGQEVMAVEGYVPDRIDMIAHNPALLRIKPVFAVDRIYDEFDRYIKLFEEIFGKV
jgi:iron(III) transport system substrate-binding protein